MKIKEVVKMTKIFPNCKTANEDSAEFCENCGEEFKQPTNVTQKNKKSSVGASGWWSKQVLGLKQ